ncbi:MAG: aminotransferase class I/II-fold pyridoxal phosphate-dependent enzyme [Acidimicrobiaceae bacterium]|nr:aminotransferase class I/II-fold pyridoxal phosphate-dependent enzyme [Acidimicrobiaceae bacterium]
MKLQADRALAYRRSEIRVLFDAAAKTPGALRLEVGEPSFTTPSHIIDAAAKAAHDGHTGYGPNGGLLSLRELLVEKLFKVNEISAEIDEVVVTPGGMNALYSTFGILLEPGDEVLLPTPGFPNMDEMIRLYSSKPVFYHLKAETSFLPDLDELKSLVTPRTKVLFINSPSNPTGCVFDDKTMTALVEFANQNDLWIVSDEVYDELVLDESVRHVPAARFDDDGRVISIFSFSKVYAMTGWRVGYLVANRQVADLARTLQEPQVSCPSTISQKAAEAALTGPRAPIDAMLTSYRKRLGLALEIATNNKIRAVKSAGTIYMLLNVGDYGSTGDVKFALDLLKSHKVSIAPGSVFGPGGIGMVRISLAASESTIEKGIIGIADFLKKGGR